MNFLKSSKKEQPLPPTNNKTNIYSTEKIPDCSVMQHIGSHSLMSDQPHPTQFIANCFVQLYHYLPICLSIY